MLTAPNPSQVMFLLLVLGHLVVGVRAGYREFHDTPRGGNRWVGAFSYAYHRYKDKDWS